jgi:hypothetical protein
VLLGIVVGLGSDCKDSGQHLFGSSPPAQGSVGSAQASTTLVDAGRETSLVSLTFPYTEGIGSLGKVVNQMSQEDTIDSRSVVWGGKVVVTLELPKNMLYNLPLVFSGGAHFTAILEPKHSLSTFDGLEFGDLPMVLQDLGKEVELREGIEVVIAPSDLTSLWTGESMVEAARVNVTSERQGNYDLVSSPGTTVMVLKGDVLSPWDGSINPGDHASLVVIPPSGTEISLSAIAR